MGWFQVGYSADLAPGDVRPLAYMGTEFVLWRDEAGTCHVMDAFCAHLGAHLGYGGCVEGTTIRCPFHAWRYDATGACVDVPYSHKVNPRARLRVRPVVEENQIIWLWWHPHGEEPSWPVPQFPEFAANMWRDSLRTEFVIATFWTEIAENALDLTHFHYVHGAAAIPHVAEFTTDGHILRGNVAHEFVVPGGSKPGLIDTTMYGPGFATVRFTVTGLAEVLFIEATTPISETHVRANFTFQVKGSGASARLADELAKEIAQQIVADVPIWEHKVYRARPLLAQGDGPIMPFRRWAKQFNVPAEAPEAE